MQIDKKLLCCQTEGRGASDDNLAHSEKLHNVRMAQAAYHFTLSEKLILY